MLALMADKKVILNLRLRPETRDQFALAAELRGASMSGLLHQFIVRTIREEKEAMPDAFANSPHKPIKPPELIEVKDNVAARIGSGDPEKDEAIRRLNEDPQLITTDQIAAIKKQIKPRRASHVGVLKQKAR